MYELQLRGISSDSDIHTLRKLFRAVVTDKVPCDVRNLTTRSVEELFETIHFKAVEMQNLIKQQEAELFQQSPRFRTRLEHLRGRLRHITELDPCASSDFFSRLDEADDRLIIDGPLDGCIEVRRTGDKKKTWSDCGSLSVLRLQVTSGPY